MIGVDDHFCAAIIWLDPQTNSGGVGWMVATDVGNNAYDRNLLRANLGLHTSKTRRSGLEPLRRNPHTFSQVGHILSYGTS